ncbi:MAG: hypothetical protein ACTTKP_11530 [Catonella sp.]|uniref:hypothetical protein n=1 Tax=Catonella sp. TaxID=2382125 RepID=UPI003FA09BCE
MSDTNIRIINISGGAIIMINPPLNCESFINIKLINKISKEDETSFLFPALFGDFHCFEKEVVSNELYEIYQNRRKDFTHENIFIFEAVQSGETDSQYNLNTLILYAEAIISAQNDIKETALSSSFEQFLQSSFYSEFIKEYNFTSSEIIILKSLIKYAFLTGIDLIRLIEEIKQNLEDKANKKLLRKEFLSVLRQRLA